MAARFVSPSTGAVALPTGFNGLFQSFDISETVAIEDVTSFGANVYGASVSNATPIQRGSATGFVRTGAASMNPGWGTNTANMGGAATFTFETGSTLAGSYIVTEVASSEARNRGVTTCRWSFANSGEITTTWATS